MILAGLNVFGQWRAVRPLGGTRTQWIVLEAL
jgi:hypothetical protein